MTLGDTSRAGRGATDARRTSRRAAVLGSPIRHSLSPVLHRAAYAALGLDWRYEAIECDEAALPAVLAGLDGRWVGLSLTMPLKRAVIPMLDEVSALAQTVGAVNTVLLDPPRRGHNTDVPGMVAALRERRVTRARRPLVLGGGATATSALAALGALGAEEVVVAVRNADRAGALLQAAERLGVGVRLSDLDSVDIAAADLAIATAPAGALDSRFGSAWPRGTALLDVVYAPWPTPLAVAAAAAGAPVISGLDLLLHQAALQVELMTACSPPPLAAMRAALGSGASSR